MKFFLVLILVLLPQDSLHEDPTPCNVNCEACDDIHDIGKISCDANDSCSITPDSSVVADDDTILDYLLGDPQIKQVTAEMCRQKCEEQATSDEDKINKKCDFFHWQEVISI